MNLTTVENAIITQLGTVITDMKIAAWPADVRDYLLSHPNGAILVHYLGSTYAEPEPNNQPKIVHDRLSEWSIYISKKVLKQIDLNPHQDVYTSIENVRTALTGYTIATLSDASVMWPTRDRLVYEEKGFWIYEMIFVFSYPEAES